jgi:hypothetical protein
MEDDNETTNYDSDSDYDFDHKSHLFIDEVEHPFYVVEAVFENWGREPFETMKTIFGWVILPAPESDPEECPMELISILEKLSIMTRIRGNDPESVARFQHMENELEEMCKYCGWLVRERVGDAGNVEKIMACVIREIDVMAVMRSLCRVPRAEAKGEIITLKRTMSKKKEKGEGEDQKTDEEKDKDTVGRPDEIDT